MIFLAVFGTQHPLVVKFSYNVQLCCLQSTERNPDWSGSIQGDAPKLKAHLTRCDKLVINAASFHRVADSLITMEALEVVASLAVYIRGFSYRAFTSTVMIRFCTRWRHRQPSPQSFRTSKRPDLPSFLFAVIYRRNNTIMIIKYYLNCKKKKLTFVVRPIYFCSFKF